MARGAYSVKIIAATVAAVVLLALMVPLCTMPECTATRTSACSDFKPACDDCPPSLVMKHTPDEASGTVALDLPKVVAVATVAAAHVPGLLGPAVVVPEVTASPPPPLDPLGVRLTV